MLLVLLQENQQFLSLEHYELIDLNDLKNLFQFNQLLQLQHQYRQ
jgi:hypothetical protein